MRKDEPDRGLRGGGWYYDPARARVANRDGHGPSIRYRSLGFRLARMVSPLERLCEAGTLRELLNQGGQP